MKAASWQGPRAPLGVGAVAVILAAALQGCGGGPDADESATREAEADTSPASVQVAGCVVDVRHALRPGRTVRALDAQGQLLAEAVSDAQGEFTLQVPGRQWLTVMVPPEGGDLLQARAGTQDVWLSSCLKDAGP